LSKRVSTEMAGADTEADRHRWIEEVGKRVRMHHAGIDGSRRSQVVGSCSPPTWMPTAARTARADFSSPLPPFIVVNYSVKFS
jgi:hypothetical protein